MRVGAAAQDIYPDRGCAAYCRSASKDLKDLSMLRPQLAAGEMLDIDDPIGHGLEVFSRVGSQIAELLPPILELCRSAECPDR